MAYGFASASSGAITLAQDEEAPFQDFYKHVRLGHPIIVHVERKNTSPKTGIVERWYKQERFLFSQRFLDANAVIIQTCWRLHRNKVPRVYFDVALLLLNRFGRSAMMTLDRLHWEPLIQQWIKPKRSARGKQAISLRILQTDILPRMHNWAEKLLQQASQIPAASAVSSQDEDPVTFQYFCINVASSTERLSVFKKLASDAGLPEVERFEAIDKKNLDPYLWMQQGALTRPALDAWNAKREFVDFACMLSHLLLWKEIQKARKPGFHVIFEDDADIPKDFLAKLQECLPTLPSDFDYVYLGHNHLLGDKVGEFWLRPHNTERKGYNALLHCSLITVKGAARLLRFMWPICNDDCIDVRMRKHFHEFNAYFYAKEFIGQRIVPSDRRPPKRQRATAVKPLQWQSLAVNPQSRKETLFWDVVRCPHLFEGLESALRVLQVAGRVIVVGNGPIEDGSLGERIDNCSAAVVRCNDFRNSTGEATHGRRCSVQVINCESHLSKRSPDKILGWIAERSAPVIVAERIAPRNEIERLVALGRRPPWLLDIAELSEEARKVAFLRDATRGFLAIALATHAMVQVGGSVELYGFGGSGHHNDPNQNIGHGVKQEWQLWTKLAQKTGWFLWHRSGIDDEGCGAADVHWQEPKTKSDIAPDASAPFKSMRDVLMASGARCLLWLIGDSSWSSFPDYDPASESSVILLHELAPNLSPAMVCNLALPRSA